MVLINKYFKLKLFNIDDSIVGRKFTIGIIGMIFESINTGRADIKEIKIIPTDE